MLHYKCMRCNRPLKNPKAQEIGYGAVCLKKIEKERETKSADVFITDEAGNPDVICRRENGVARSNVIHGVALHSPSGMDWGYGGSGPADLALNILLRAGLDRHEAERLHQEFKWQFVCQIPAEGGIIPAYRIQQFIADNKAQPELL